MESSTKILRRMLDERGVEWSNVRNNGYESDYLTKWQLNGIQGHAFVTATEWPGGLSLETYQSQLTPEQAIAATLGSELPYDELLRCLENDWHISASWDGLRKFWCIELTEEGVKLRNSAHSTLTAEQVRKAIFNDSSYASYDGAKYYADGVRMQAIANELNATLGAVTCKVESMHGYTDAHTHTSWCVELSCHTLDAWEDSIPPSYCPICGRKVVDDG